MAARSLKATLSAASDSLLSLKSDPTQHAAAFADLERLVASLALDPHHSLLDAFLRHQDSFHRNTTATLLEWLGRILTKQPTAGAETGDNILRCLRLIQGLLLLHRPSQRLFGRRSSLEYLLAVLDMTRPSHPFSPHLSSPAPFPSPVLFPPSPYSSPNLASRSSAASAHPATTTPLALAVLDTLLCTLVDRPKNMRVFEELDGLAAVVKVLKDKSAEHVVRIKAIELLYYYLLPESSFTAAAPPSPESSFSSGSSAAASTYDSRIFAESSNLPHLLATAADFVPQTPQKARPHSSYGSDDRTPFSPSARSARTSTSSRESSPSRTPRQLRHKRSQSLISLSSLAREPTPSPAPSPRLSASLAASPRLPPSSPSIPRSTSRLQPRTSLSRASQSEEDAVITPRAARSPRPSTSDSVPPSPRQSHRRTQSVTSISRSTGIAAAAVPESPFLPIETRRESRIRLSKGSSDAEEMPPPPLPSSSSSSSSASTRARPSHARSRSAVGLGHGPSSRASSAASSASTTSSRPSRPTSSLSSLAPPTFSLPPQSQKRPRHTRTEDEKRALLRRVMPNVDALEDRFRAMGLGVGAGAMDARAS
ncbi:uncharacterized protein JCM10292_001060 [Rhodotorula paludigena]|uniref:uncharacterized protein n=1 Tax=Rhodotorula paludigena TaxID=86838 RepID=UPI00316FD2BD